MPQSRFGFEPLEMNFLTPASTEPLLPAGVEPRNPDDSLRNYESVPR